MAGNEQAKFDVDTLTLGEMLAVEEASGLTSDVILKSFSRRSTLRLLVAVFVLRLRSSGEPPSWRSLTDLPILDALSRALAIVSGQPISEVERLRFKDVPYFIEELKGLRGHR